MEDRRVLVDEKVVWEEEGTVRAVVVGREAPLVIVGGDAKNVTGLNFLTGEKTYQFCLPRKIFALTRLSDDELLVVDTAGVVRAFQERDGANLRELFGHFAPVTAVLVVGDYIVTADVDTQVRVCKKSAPREILAYLLGNATPVLGLYRGAHDGQVVCVTRERVVKYFDLETASQVDPFANSVEIVHHSKKSKAKE